MSREGVMDGVTDDRRRSDLMPHEGGYEESHPPLEALQGRVNKSYPKSSGLRTIGEPCGVRSAARSQASR
jgi:hypothetical protein